MRNQRFVRRFSFLWSVSILLVAAASSRANAQLCNGSLGDPVVNITFGSGDGGRSSYVPSGSYTYTSSNCPDDGYYTITKKTSDCFNGTWFTVPGDHTGGGAFMLVNASYTPGDFFFTTVTDLCPNTTYEFAVWVVNVMKTVNSILPELTFSVETTDGTVLNYFDTGDIHVTGTPEWKKYGFYFTTSPGNPVIVLRITNHAPGGFGNDLGLDDITFRPCGPKIPVRIAGAGSDTIDVCEEVNNGYSYTFVADVPSGYTSPLYQWQISTDKGTTWNDIPGATALAYQESQLSFAGNYWYRLSVIEASSANISSCRIASDALVINIHPKPAVSAGTDRVMLVNNSIALSGKATGEELTYSWSPDKNISDVSQLDPLVSPPADVTYILSAQSSWGCKNADSVYIKVVAGVFPPTAFTPNGDGKNDRWEIPFLDPSLGGTVSVFNRWGQLVYHISAATVSWDGTFNGVLQNSGTYIYLITFNHSSMVLKGTVTLIR